MQKYSSFILAFVFIVSACGVKQVHKSLPKPAGSDKIVIYQLLPRLFGNKKTLNKINGSKEENGTGKFNDISNTALISLKKLGITHMWYTGVIEHATMTDHSAAGIKLDDPDVIKGRAGSPYAIKDYYDVDPDLAHQVDRRMADFEELIARTHKQEMKVIIDFVPNHVARYYHSDVKPAGVRDFGQDDNTSLAYSPTNDFYYISDKSLVLPEGVNAGGDHFRNSLKDNQFPEYPAKVTGNNVFSEKPSINDWFETVKLNYGIENSNPEKRHFDPVPPVWTKMRDILKFWAAKKVDGFRCDVVEMVPVEFWEWVIPQVKQDFPNLIFIGEAYDPAKYREYLGRGGFDYVYDKVGLYDALKRLIRNDEKASINQIRDILKEQGSYLQPKMLRFLENHDEERIASGGFAGSPWPAWPAMVISATISGGPVMIYSGQEVGEPGRGVEGFGGEDNRTTIFDYWGIPEHQKWMNGGKFDGALLSSDQQKLRQQYSNLLNLAKSHPALTKGDFREINLVGSGRQTFAFIRTIGQDRMLIIANFMQDKAFETEINLSLLGENQASLTDAFTAERITAPAANLPIKIKVPASGAAIYYY